LPGYGFIIRILTTQRRLLFFSGLETDRAAGHSSFRHFAAGQHHIDGRRVLVAVHPPGQLDPIADEPCSDWLQWLNYLLWPVAVISVLLVFGYFFSTIANWIAAPFNGLLAEQLEARLPARRRRTRACRHHERYPAHYEA
jgi:hypothetical protein